VQSLHRLLGSLRQCCDDLPDRRCGENKQFAMVDFVMAGFSVFFMQSPSFLQHQRRLAEGCGRSNCETLFGMSKIPGDSQIRAMLDPLAPELFDPAFGAALEELRQTGGLSLFTRLDGRVLIALDGTEYHRSAKVHCPHCSTRKRSGGETEYFHALLAASLVAPGHNRVLPLPPEFIVPQDGCDKQDCESRAARRWLAKHGGRYATLRPVYLGDDLFSRQPMCAAAREAGGHFLFVCKPSSHPAIEEFRSGIETPQLTQEIKLGKQRALHRYRWLCDVPLRGDAGAMAVNWFSIEILSPAGEIKYRNSFITDLPVGRDTVAGLAACGRARWKIENESFNTLKTKGYHLEHNFGHGKANLSAVLVALNLLAFAFHAVCGVAAELWAAAMQKAGSRQEFFQRLRSMTTYLIFPCWEELLGMLAFARPPPLGP
jgi:hypothetical protein